MGNFVAYYKTWWQVGKITFKCKAKGQHNVFLSSIRHSYMASVLTYIYPVFQTVMLWVTMDFQKVWPWIHTLCRWLRLIEIALCSKSDWHFEKKSIDLSRLFPPLWHTPQAVIPAGSWLVAWCQGRQLELTETTMLQSTVKLIQQ